MQVVYSGSRSSSSSSSTGSSSSIVLQVVFSNSILVFGKVEVLVK